MEERAMPLGKGKYDDQCKRVMKETKANGVILIVNEGEKGNGFSSRLTLEDTLRMPSILRSVADVIEKSHKKGKI